MKLFLFILLLLLNVSASSQETGKRESLDVLLINMNNISKSEKDNITYGLLQLNIQNGLFDTIVLKKRQLIYYIVKDSFNLHNDKLNTITNKIVGQIGELNNTDPAHVFERQKILIPKTLQNIGDNTTKENYQYALVVDVVNNTSYIQNTDSLLIDDSLNKIHVSLLTKINPSILAYKLYPEDYNVFYQNISDKLKERMKDVVFTLVKKTTIKKASDTAIPQQQLDFSIKPHTDLYADSVIRLLERIDTSFWGKYYVMDLFQKDSCRHGNKVIDVVRLTLEEYNAQRLYSKVIPVPLNVLGNEDIIKEYLYPFLDTARIPQESTKVVNWLSNKAQIFDALYPKEEIKNLYQNEETCCPKEIFSNLINVFYNAEADVISTSCAFDYDQEIFPQIRKDSKTVLLTAAVNKDNFAIEDLTDIPVFDEGEIPSALQPLKSYYLHYPSIAGCIIVGNCVFPGKSKGMISKDGSKITTLGYGTGYIGHCIKSNDVGTSFSTPKVSTQIFLAKGYWKQQGMDLTPLDIRTNVTLATDLDTNFIGKFASSGVLNTYKLILSPTGFIQKQSDQITTCEYNRDKSFMILADSNKYFFSRDGDHAISGLYFTGSKAFAFFNYEQKWSAIQILSMNLEISGENRTYDNPREIAENIKQIVFSPLKK